MPDIKLHSPIYGRHPGETVTVTEGEAKFALELGYASADGHDPEDVAGEPVIEVTTADDPRLADNREDDDAIEREPKDPPVFKKDAIQTKEAFDPTPRTVDEVNAYLAQLTDDAGGRAERDRVLAVERENKNRSTIDGV